MSLFASFVVQKRYYIIIVGEQFGSILFLKTFVKTRPRANSIELPILLNCHKHKVDDFFIFYSEMISRAIPSLGRVEIYWNVHCFSADPVVSKMEGSQLTIEFLLQNGFDQPIIIEEKEGLGLRVPSEYFTVQDVEALVGKFT